MTADPAEEAALLEQIGVASRNLGHLEASVRTLETAVERFRELGDRRSAARATEALARSLAFAGRLVESMPLLEAAEADIADLAPDPVLAEIRLGLALNHMQLGDGDAALAWADRGLADAERLERVDLVLTGMIIKGGILITTGRPLEGRALLSASLELADSRGDGPAGTRATHSLTLSLMEDDPRAAVRVGRDAIERGRRYGLGPLWRSALANVTEASLGVGDWSWIEAEQAEIRLDELEPSDRAQVLVSAIELAGVRGLEASDEIADLRAFRATSKDPQSHAAISLALAYHAQGIGRSEDAYREAMSAVQDPLNAPFALLIAARAAIRLHDADRAADALRRLDDLGARGAAGRIERAALGAAVDGLEGRWVEAAAGFREAWRRYRELGLDVALAVSVLDCLAVAPPAERLADEGAEEARSLLERHGASGYLAQLDALEAERAESSPPARGRRPTGAETEAAREG